MGQGKVLEMDIWVAQVHEIESKVRMFNKLTRYLVCGC